MEFKHHLAEWQRSFSKENGKKLCKKYTAHKTNILGEKKMTWNQEREKEDKR